jgi:uncharacterized protein
MPTAIEQITDMATRLAPQGHPLLDRRAWLLLAAASASAAVAPPARAATAASAGWRLLTAWDADGQSWAGTWTPGQTPRGIALPNRAHEVLSVPGSANGQALAVARRPGEYLVRFDTRRNQVLQWHDMEPDRLLSGHAIFTPDGRALYTAEFDADSGAGLVVERDPKTLRRRREFTSGGIGPHALLLEPGGSLLVANGGLLTLPETGRRKLNRDRMDASLARLDLVAGEVRQIWRVDDPFLSLRHLARSPEGTVAVALQAEHAQPQARAQAPLLALLDAGEKALRCIALPAGPGLSGYAGDVAWLPTGGPLAAADTVGGSFVVSATQAGHLAWWSPRGVWQGQRALPEAGALATRDGAWLACGAAGQVQGTMASRDFKAGARNGVRWDNHARFL